MENQGTNEDDSQSDPHPEAGIFRGETTQNSGPKDCHDMVTGVQGEIRYRPDMVTGGSEEMRNCLDMVTAVQEEIPYCSSGISSGKQQKECSISQPKFAVRKPLRHLRQTRFCWLFSNWRRTVILPMSITLVTESPKSLMTTMPTSDGKSEKFELFKDLFQTSLKIHNQLTEEDKIYYFHSLMSGDALQTFKNITSPNRENLGEILTVFRRKYVKPQSMATAKHKLQRPVFNPVNQKLIDFLDELQKLAKDAFGVDAQAIIEQFIYAKMPPHLKKSIKQAHLENGTYELIVTHLERE